MTDNRQDRLNALKKAVSEYSTKERTRLQNELAILKSVVSGRSVSVSDNSIMYVSGVAEKSLLNYLNGV